MLFRLAFTKKCQIIKEHYVHALNVKKKEKIMLVFMSTQLPNGDTQKRIIGLLN
jgi:hypothetical protein